MKGDKTMEIKDKEYGIFEVSLSDDGTLDTVIEVCHEGIAREFRYSCEYAAFYRDENGAMTEEGLRELGEESVDAFIEENLI